MNESGKMICSDKHNVQMSQVLVQVMVLCVVGWIINILFWFSFIKCNHSKFYTFVCIEVIKPLIMKHVTGEVKLTLVQTRSLPLFTLTNVVLTYTKIVNWINKAQKVSTGANYMKANISRKNILLYHKIQYNFMHMRMMICWLDLRRIF